MATKAMKVIVKLYNVLRRHVRKMVHKTKKHIELQKCTGKRYQIRLKAKATVYIASKEYKRDSNKPRGSLKNPCMTLQEAIEEADARVEKYGVGIVGDGMTMSICKGKEDNHARHRQAEQANRR